MDAGHARDIIFEMNQDFSQPLIVFHGNPNDCDLLQLTAKGEQVAGHIGNNLNRCGSPLSKSEVDIIEVRRGRSS